MLDKLVDLYIEMLKALMHPPMFANQGMGEGWSDGKMILQRLDDGEGLQLIPPNIKHEKDYLEKLIDHYLKDASVPIEVIDCAS